MLILLLRQSMRSAQPCDTDTDQFSTRLAPYA